MVRVVSIVRDRGMYDRCVSSNPAFRGCELCPIDNTVENRPITLLYNRFLDDLAGDCWICFCHEDWMPHTDIASLVETFDKSCLYGPVGVFVEERKRVDVIVPRGSVSQTRKDGSRQITITGKDVEGRVDTFDCQCFFVHSSVVSKFGLRFDEALTFDMYVEDFCVSAYERYGIESRTVRIDCTHFSAGKLSERFYDSLAYVRGKYAVSKKRYATIVGHLNTFGGDSAKTVFKWKRIPWVKLRYRIAK